MKITKLQLGLMIYFILRAFFFFIYRDFSISISSIVLGTMVGVFIIWLFHILFSPKKTKEKNGLKLLLFPILLFLFFFIFKRLLYFINSNYLPTYPLFVIGFSILLLVIFLLKGKVHVLYKSTEICFFISIFIYIISLCSLLSQVDVLPIVQNIKINRNTLWEGISYGIKSLFPLLIITNIDHQYTRKDIYKTTIISYVITNIFIIIKLSLLLGILSSSLISRYSYPFISVLKNISFYDFIDHMESLLGFEYLFDGFLLLFSISFYIKDILSFIKEKILSKRKSIFH